MEAAGSRWKLLDAVGVCHRYFIQDQAVAREASERSASFGWGAAGAELDEGGVTTPARQTYT
jgi:hypothetical protein